jgi:LmbE family N-acetylglucosaminyl deacetylase
MSTSVVCATRGEAGEGDATDLGAVRERELREAAELLGVGRVDLLGFSDSGMSGEPGPATLAGAPFEQVVAEVRKAVDAVRPDVLVTLDASDGHRDHARIRDAAVEAAAAAGVPRVYLACLPRSLMRRWAAHMQAQRPDMPHLDADVAALGTPDEQITTVIDAAEHLPAREKAIAVHASQTSPFEGLPADLRRAFLADVHLRRITPTPDPGVRDASLLA